MSDVKNDARFAKFLDALRQGATREEAVGLLGVTSRTVRRWCEADPEIAEAVADAASRADDAVEAVVYRNCLDPDPAHNTLRMFWLKSRRPEVYRDVQAQQHEGGVRITVAYEDRSPTPGPRADDPPAPPPPGAG